MLAILVEPQVLLFQLQQLLVILLELLVRLCRLRPLLVILAESQVRLSLLQFWVAQLAKQLMLEKPTKQFSHQVPSNQHIYNQKFATHHHVQTHGC